MKRRPTRSIVLQVRVTAAEKKALELEAINADISVSELCRIKLIGITFTDLRERRAHMIAQAIANAPATEESVTLMQEFGGKLVPKAKGQTDR